MFIRVKEGADILGHNRPIIDRWYHWENLRRTLNACSTIGKMELQMLQIQMVPWVYHWYKRYHTYRQLVRMEEP